MDEQNYDSQDRARIAAEMSTAVNGTGPLTTDSGAHFRSYSSGLEVKGLLCRN